MVRAKAVANHVGTDSLRSRGCSPKGRARPRCDPASNSSAHGFRRPRIASRDNHRGKRTERHPVAREARRGVLVFAGWADVRQAVGRLNHLTGPARCDREIGSKRSRGSLEPLVAAHGVVSLARLVILAADDHDVVRAAWIDAHVTGTDRPCPRTGRHSQRRGAPGPRPHRSCRARASSGTAWLQAGCGRRPEGCWSQARHRRTYRVRPHNHALRIRCETRCGTVLVDPSAHGFDRRHEACEVAPGVEARLVGIPHGRRSREGIRIDEGRAEAEVGCRGNFRLKVGDLVV